MRCSHLFLQQLVLESRYLQTVSCPANTSKVENESNEFQKSLSMNFYIETYGCQMNVSDSEIINSVLTSSGHNCSKSIEDADVILVNTCAIREKAEEKIWHRLKYFQSMRNKRRPHTLKGEGYPIVGVLGCMAERLKTKLLEEECVQFVCGPDAYRDIPRLLHQATSTDQKAANVQLSFDETYADITPIRETSNASAFLSIMRGCNNMCSCEKCFKLVLACSPNTFFQIA